MILDVNFPTVCLLLECDELETAVRTRPLIFELYSCPCNIQVHARVGAAVTLGSVVHIHDFLELSSLASLCTP